MLRSLDDGMTKYALVTGSDGFIGRHMVRQLEISGYTVTKVDMPDDCRNFFASSEEYFDVVVHAAAYIGGRIGIENKSTFLAAYNLQLDSALFEWALKNKPRHIVCFSSSAVYPVELQEMSRRNKVKALREIDQSVLSPRLPDASYGWTKLNLERLVYEYVKDTGRSCHVVRPFSGYGHDQGVEYPFGAFLLRTLRRSDPFEIWGDGTQVRDWVHVNDICAAVMVMIKDDIPGPVNLCSGIPMTFLDLVALFIAKSNAIFGGNYAPLVVYRKDKPTGVSFRYGSTERMKTFYSPRVTIAEGIINALKV